jgi:hypothetical protein
MEDLPLSWIKLKEFGRKQKFPSESFFKNYFFIAAIGGDKDPEPLT